MPEPTSGLAELMQAHRSRNAYASPVDNESQSHPIYGDCLLRPSLS